MIGSQNNQWHILSTWRYSFSAAIILFAVAIILLRDNPRILLTGPREVPQQMLLLESIWTSIERVFLGGVIAFLCALFSSLALFLASKRHVFYFTLVFLILAITPPPIWSTIVIMWLGLGPASPVVTIILSTVFMVAAINLYLLTQIPRRRFHIGEVYSINTVSQVKFILLPEVRSGLALGLRLNLLVAWIALITAESFGASSGLGALLLAARQLFDWTGVAAAWASIVACALLTDAIATSLATRLDTESLASLTSEINDD